MAISGQTTVTTAGTAVRLSAISLKVNGPIMVKAVPANAGVMYVGEVNGDVDTNNGMPLSAGEPLIFNGVVDLYNIWVDASISGEKVAWLLLNIPFCPPA